MSYPPQQQPGFEPPTGWTPGPGNQPGAPGQQPSGQFGAPGPQGHRSGPPPMGPGPQGQVGPGQVPQGQVPQGQVAQGQIPYGQGAPGPGGPTGQLVLELRKPWGSVGMIRAIGKIDGYPVAVNWGHNEITVPAGARNVDIRAQYLWEYGRADQTVTVEPGRSVQLHYTPPAFTMMGGRLAASPQPVPGKTAAIVLFSLLGLIILLCIILPLAFG